MWGPSLAIMASGAHELNAFKANDRYDDGSSRAGHLASADRGMQLHEQRMQTCTCPHMRGGTSSVCYSSVMKKSTSNGDCTATRIAGSAATSCQHQLWRQAQEQGCNCALLKRKLQPACAHALEGHGIKAQATNKCMRSGVLRAFACCRRACIIKASSTHLLQQSSRHTSCKHIKQSTPRCLMCSKLPATPRAQACVSHCTRSSITGAMHAHQKPATAIE